jgi:hypothetical protein
METEASRPEGPTRHLGADPQKQRRLEGGMMDDELKEQLDRLTNGVELDRAQWIIADILERFDERLRALEQRDGDWRKP